MLVPTEGEMTASLHGDREPYRPAALRADDLAQLSEALARCRSCLAAALGELGSSEGVESLPELRAEGLLRTVQAELEVVKLRQAELENRVLLYKALGGGWQPDQKP